MTPKKRILCRDRFPVSLPMVCRWSFGFSIVLGLFLITGNLAGIASQDSEATEDAPLGLELWLSGEEPTGPEVGEEDPSLVPDPLIEENALEGNSLEPMPPLEVQPSSPESLAQEDDRSVPTVVIEERASGCTVQLNGEGAMVSSEGACSGKILTGEALGSTLEQQWEQWYGEPSHDAANAPASPLQVGVQAIGSAMQVSPFIEDYYFQTERPAPLASENDRRMLFPLKSWAPITSVFGWRSHPISQTWRLHTGTDLGAFWGTPVVAAFSGTVEVADVLDGYGVTVVLYHPQRSQQTLYAHLSEVYVKPGEFIPQGTVLGRVGSTGNSTGPHLHFELREWQDSGWVALDAGAELTTASLGTEGDSPLLAAASPPINPGQPLAPNALQQWITWFLQVLSNLA